jgi:hypothetical protein
MTDEQINKLCAVFTQGMQALIEAIQGVEAQLQQLAIAANPAPNFHKPLAEYWTFDWSLIGAIPRSSDQEGVTSVEWNGRLFTRRSPQNKFQESVWFSRAIGRDELGNNKYEKLITFKNAGEAEELGSKVKKAAPPVAEPSAASQSAPAKTVVNAEEIAAEYMQRQQIKAFGCASERTWRVGPDGASFEVWRDEAGTRQCNCSELAALRKRQPKAECAHIMAVALFVSAKPKPASREPQGQAPTRDQ